MVRVSLSSMLDGKFCSNRICNIFVNFSLIIALIFIFIFSAQPNNYKHQLVSFSKSPVVDVVFPKESYATLRTPGHSSVQTFWAPDT